ncbi:hypothetical protein GCM10007860_17640 [Chitiniphilus shinanonensis]|uniref:Uncharacterized protein n=1 Tax=Chitiniphilus shinanonensis TaxID=553088 RepID=A0ABQ6BT49_9NEIS|nr:hypothetical protein [Chitiniphilus shinanonensis]GLS04617.1 hypothetical protein GCM10007860_17640 [Chitiniphilus shinanonensis]
MERTTLHHGSGPSLPDYDQAYRQVYDAAELNDLPDFDEWTPLPARHYVPAGQGLEWLDGGRHANSAAWLRLHARFKPQDILG